MRPPDRRGFLLLFLFLTLAATGQESPPAPQYTEEIEVRVIDIDVVVTDRHGNPLTNLKREDFELYEDGKRVEIPYFSRIVDGRIADLPPLPPDSAPTAADPNVPAAAPSVAPRVPLTWVIFIDHTNLSPQRRNQAMRQLQQFLQRAITNGDRGIIALNDGRSFRVRQGLTEDAKLLMDVLARMEKERMSVSPIQNKRNVLLGQMRRSEADWGNVGMGPSQEDFMAQTAGNDVTFLIEEEAKRTKFAILALGSMLDALARVEGRLALVYVGAGFNTLPAADLAAIWRSRYQPFVGQPFEPKPEEEREPIQREITRLFDNLSALRVTVYTIHGGEQSGSVTSAEDMGQLQPHIDSSNDITALLETGHAREMAQRTGGLYFKVNQSLASQLEAVRRDLGNYYSLGYKPAGSADKTRRIRVRVNVDGARVRHRETVRERTRHEQAQGTLVASMVQPQPRVAKRAAQTAAPAIPATTITAANPLGVHVEAAAPRADGWTGDFVLPFNFSIQLEALTFVKQGNARRAEFVMHFSLVGKDGAVYPLESREQALAIPENELPKDPNAQVSYSWHVDLAPLKIPAEVPRRDEGLRLTVTVEDRASAVRSVITVPVGKSGGGTQS